MYDVKCYELAEAFLSDEGAINTTRNTEVIAQMIQDIIEEEIADLLAAASFELSTREGQRADRPTGREPLTPNQEAIWPIVDISLEDFKKQYE